MRTNRHIPPLRVSLYSALSTRHMICCCRVQAADAWCSSASKAFVTHASNSYALVCKSVASPFFSWIVQLRPGGKGVWSARQVKCLTVPSANSFGIRYTRSPRPEIKSDADTRFYAARVTGTRRAALRQLHGVLCVLRANGV